MSKRDKLKDVKQGDIIDVVVVAVYSYGVFVTYNKIVGLLHVKDFSWELVDLFTLVKKGDVLKVVVLDIDYEKSKISFGKKQLEMNPYVDFNKKVNLGDVVDCNIFNKSNNDYIVDIAKYKVKAMLISDKEFNLGEELKVRVNKIDVGNKKIFVENE